MVKSFSAMFFSFLNPKKITFWLVFLGILLCAGIYYTAYKKVSNPNPRNAEDVANSSGTTGGDVEVLMFKVDWCPHCKKAEPAWNDFKNTYHGKKIKGRNIRCKTLDLTEKSENDPIAKKNENIAKDYAEKYKVEGYPTIKMIKDGQVIEFDAKVSTFALEKFVDDMV